MPEPDAIDHYVEHVKKQHQEEQKARTMLKRRRSHVRIRHKHLIWSLCCLLILVVTAFFVGNVYGALQNDRLKNELTAKENELAKVQSVLNDTKTKLAYFEHDVTFKDYKAMQAPQVSQPVAPRPVIIPLPPDMQAKMAADASNDPTVKAMLDPNAEEWKNRYDYAAMKYNRLVGDYTKLRNKYKELVGVSEGKGGVITGLQFYQYLLADNREKLDEINKKIRRGVRTSELKEVQAHKAELESRDWWIRRASRTLKMTN